LSTPPIKCIAQGPTVRQATYYRPHSHEQMRCVTSSIIIYGHIRAG